MSEFSDFIREATPEQKAEVYAEVMRRAAERQAQVMNGDPSKFSHGRMPAVDPQ